MGEIAGVWRSISDEEKGKYTKLAEEDKVRYQQEKAEESTE